MKASRTSIILCVLILSGLLTVFNNCGDSTVMNDPIQESSKSSEEDPAPTPAPTPDPGDGGGYVPSSLRIVSDKMEVMKGQKAQLSVMDGLPPYNITVSPNSAGSVNNTSREFTANSAGVATVTVTDSMGVTATIALNVKQPKTCAVPWGGTVEEGQSIKAYRESHDNKCPYEMRVCGADGKLTGSWVKRTCKR